MKIATKTSFYCGMIALFLFLYYISLNVKNENIVINRMLEVNKTVKTLKNVTNNKMKYILQWTSPIDVPLVYIGVGQESFIERKCPYTNCFVTANRSYLGSYVNFDVIAFAGKEVVYLNSGDMPDKRLPHQKYVFATMESSDYYPVCSNKLNGIFNWTWTYRLDSDAEWGYIVVRDAGKNVIGPKRNMNWIKLEDMKPVNKKIRDRLLNKTKAAAWFVSNCDTRGSREKFVSQLKVELRKFSLKVDIYGQCGLLTCSRNFQDKCDSMLEKDYYFYLSFENSFAEDYVTEKLLYPLQHLTVPIVYGGANYTRFMADGMYINAQELGPQRLADKMNQLIKNPDQYADYFKWINHYSYHKRSESAETDDICRFCSILNQEETVKKPTVYQNFRDWWDPPRRC